VNTSTRTIIMSSLAALPAMRRRRDDDPGLGRCVAASVNHGGLAAARLAMS
jgi:hypothetical protein